jgi:uncharacterized protein (UPF0332 family)
MTDSESEEIKANLDRAMQSLDAARDLLAKGYYDFAASRAYYSAFYAATALLLNAGLESSKHSGVISAIHQRFVKPGILEKKIGRDLNWLFELRGLGDYGGLVHVTLPQAEEAIHAAVTIIESIMAIIPQNS